MRAQPIPIGLAYVAGHLDRTRHEVKLVDLMFADTDYLGEVEQVVAEFQPELVGISIRNLSNHSYMDPQWQLPITKGVIERIRSISNATIVCGGPAFSIMPQQIFEFVKPDLGIAGDAAETFAELVNRVEIGEPDYRGMTGVLYRENGEVVYNGMRCSSDFVSRPSLDDLDISKYAQAGFGVSVLTKLGGFYYPTSAADFHTAEGAWRVIRPIDEVVEEVAEVTDRYGLRKIFFVDNCFNVPLEHAKSLCNALMEAQVKVRWNTCLAPYACDSELIGLMKQAGCGLVMMGGYPRRRPPRGRQRHFALRFAQGNHPAMRRRRPALHHFAAVRRTGRDSCIGRQQAGIPARTQPVLGEPARGCQRDARNRCRGPLYPGRYHCRPVQS